MKENPYDSESFLTAYLTMRRSTEGLDGAGEWPTVRALLPDLAGARVLDLGCGLGWHCRYALAEGASRVVGVDISTRMIERARATGPDVIEYRNSAFEDVTFEPGSFDCVLSSLALHYTPSYRAIIQRIASWLAPGGRLVFSVEHPVFTASGDQDWVRRESGEIDHFPVDRYFEEGPRSTVFLGESVIKYHRTLTSYLGELTTAGLAVDAVVEPEPPADWVATDPDMADERRRPMMLVIAAHAPT